MDSFFILSVTIIIIIIMSFAALVTPSLASGSPIKGAPLTYSYLFGIFTYFLEKSDTPVSFQAPAPESALIPLSRKWYLETRIWVLGVPTAAGVSLLLSPWIRHSSAFHRSES